MKTKHLLVAFLATLFLISCGNKKTDGTNNNDSANWAGVYEGVLPCADCPGIENVLTLNEDMTYVLKTKYQERSDVAYEEKGAISWNKDKGIITATPNNGEEATMYKVEKNQVRQLDMDGNEITGNLAELYILKKK